MQYDLSKLILGRNGNYYDRNKNLVGYKGKGLIGDAWKHLKANHGSDWANNVSRQMRAGNIYQNNKWRPFDVQSDFKRTATWEEALKNFASNAQAGPMATMENGRWSWVDERTGKRTYFTDPTIKSKPSTISATNTTQNSNISSATNVENNLPVNNYNENNNQLYDYSRNFNDINSFNFNQAPPYLEGTSFNRLGGTIKYFK